MIDVLVSGTNTVLQDLGRMGYRKFGVPAAGAMDAHSARLANQLIRNPDNAPVLEFIGQGPVLRFNSPGLISIQGAKFNVRVNNELIDINLPCSIKESDQLTFGTAVEGLYGYLAIQGGFNAPMVLGSVSFYEGITPQDRIKKGDKLSFNSNDDQINFPSHSTKIIEALNYSSSSIEVTKGPEFEKLSNKTQDLLENEEFILSNEINRMGYRLIGNQEIRGFEILTSPVQPGTIQLTPSGQLIVLMRDGQTTGGYARILQLSEISLSVLAQKRPGEKINFKFKNID